MNFNGPMVGVTFRWRARAKARSHGLVRIPELDVGADTGMGMVFVEHCHDPEFRHTGMLDKLTRRGNSLRRNAVMPGLGLCNKGASKRRRLECNVVRPLQGGLMSKRIGLIVVAAGITASVAYAQFPVMDRVADKVIQKYQSSTCQQLWQEKAQGQGQPKPEMEQRAIQMLKQDPQMRQAFFNKVSAPIVNKMFECGMIP
jgi:hypothetical protein